MIITDRSHTSSALLPALLFSLLVHAGVVGVLFNGKRAPVELTPPLKVTLEAAPTPVIENVPVQVEHRHVKHEATRRPPPAPTLALDHMPAQVTVPAARVEAPVPAVIPAPEPAPAPTIVARAPATVRAPGRAEAIEPPHFNVAYLNNPRPAYPPIARRLGLEGLVVLRVQVGAGGAPEQVSVAQTSGTPMLDDAAQKAVQGWMFVPARRGDTPVAHAVEVPVRFQLKN